VLRNRLQRPNLTIFFCRKDTSSQKKCHNLVSSVTEDIENYQLGVAGSKVYEFLWDQYADWYIEISKTRLYEGAGGDNEAEAKAARRVLVYILDTSLRLLHPYMPYVTEQL